MKLHYLANVQKLLEAYDFQDKYKVMLDLEKTLTEMEVDGQIDHETLLNSLGTPADFVEEIVNKYDLSLIANQANNSKMNQFSGQSVNPDVVANPSSYDGSNNYEHAQSANSYSNDYANRDGNREYLGNRQKSSDYERNSQSEASQQTSQKQQSATKQGESIAVKGAKAPFKVFFTIITIIFFILAFFIFAAAVVASVILLVWIDVQTAISLVLGVLFMLLAIIVSINLIKNIIYAIIERRLKMFKLISMFIFILLFAFLSKIMLSSTLETVNMHITSNLGTIQNLFYNRGIDVSNINWQDMSIGEYTKLFGDMIKSAL